MVRVGVQDGSDMRAAHQGVCERCGVERLMVAVSWSSSVCVKEDMVDEELVYTMVTR